MKPSERAEIIRATINPYDSLPPEIIKFIAAQIEEAEKEAHCSCAGRCNTCYEEGFRAAREKGAEIVRIKDGETRTRLDLEKDIRQMEPSK